MLVPLFVIYTHYPECNVCDVVYAIFIYFFLFSKMKGKEEDNEKTKKKEILSTTAAKNAVHTIGRPHDGCGNQMECRMCTWQLYLFVELFFFISCYLCSLYILDAVLYFHSSGDKFFVLFLTVFLSPRLYLIWVCFVFICLTRFYRVWRSIRVMFAWCFFSQSIHLGTSSTNHFFVVDQTVNLVSYVYIYFLSFFSFPPV